MTPPGDAARVTISVQVEPALAFKVFTEDIDQWWRRGLRFRGTKPSARSVIHLEPKAGGRLFESFETGAGPKVLQTGTVTHWEPPARLVFEWKPTNFRAGEVTEVEVLFEPTASGTRVTLTHRGWSTIRPDHPARHRLEAAPFIRMMGMWWADLLESLRVTAAASAKQSREEPD
jgi:uncharacterized protein YndB with AHSA1/START domain